MSYQSQYTGEQIDEAVGKASKALVTPDTAPSSVVIPAIGTDNAQTNLTLGDGLSVSGGVLSASGGGGGGGIKLYRHVIRFFDGSTSKGAFVGILTHNTPVTDFDTFVSQHWLPKGFESDFVVYLYDDMGMYTGLKVYSLGSTGFTWESDILPSYTFTDDDIREY